MEAVTSYQATLDEEEMAVAVKWYANKQLRKAGKPTMPRNAKLADCSPADGWFMFDVQIMDDSKEARDDGLL